MSFVFETYGASQSGGNKRESNVDWDAYHEYIIEAAGLQDREVMQGKIVHLVDLGVQEQPDAEFEFAGTEEDEEYEIEKNPGTYFKTANHPETKKPTRYKCWPQKPIQAIVFGVDFNGVQIDYTAAMGGEGGETKPLRMWLGGQFYMEGKGMIVQRPIYLKENKKLGDWSFDQKSLPYKIAVAAKIIKPGEIFKANRIGELLGVSVNWTVQIFNKPSKTDKKKLYSTEYIQFASGLSRGQKEDEFDAKLHMTGFNKDNDPESLKEIRNHIRNTMSLAANYEGSKIQAQLDALFTKKESNASQGDEPQEKEEKPVVKKEVKKVIKPKVEVQDDLDDDIPF